MFGKSKWGKGSPRRYLGGIEMRIQHNITALNSYRQLNSNNNSVAKNLEKLSSGYRINRAGDDAAGLAISEKMRAQIKGLEAAQKNANDGISLIQTAEGNLTEVHSMLNRMVELATMASNGTYEDTNRGQYQKEIDALNEEIDRISQSANFNGKKLLDGTLSTYSGLEIGTLQDKAAVNSAVDFATMGPAVDGVYTGGKAETKHSATFYIGDITNNAADAKDLTLKYKDNNGVEQTVTFSVAKDTKLTAQQIYEGLKNGTGINDTGTAISGTDHGKFTDLFDVSLDGSILTVTAKNENGATINGGTIKSDKVAVGELSVANFEATDITAATKHINEDLANAGTATNVTFGQHGQVTAFVDKTAGTYQIASTSLEITKGAADLHNTAVKVGDSTYVFKTAGKGDLKGVDPSKVKVVDLGAGDAAAVAAQKLAAAITASEGTNGGYMATAKAPVAGAGNLQTGTAATITIFESTNRANQIINQGGPATKGADVASIQAIELEAASGTADITIDKDKLVSGTTVSVGGKNYMLTTEEKTGSKTTTYVKYNKEDSSEEIAKKLAAAIGEGASAAGNKVTATTKEAVEALGKGLVLQVGESNDSYQKMNVAIKSTSTKSLGVDKVDVTSEDSAGAAIDTINTAIDKVSDIRATLGALQNRLDHTINNLGVATENITAAESRIRDTDMAKEMMDFTKNNILVQAAQAMLAQANMVPQSVLQLLQ